MNWLSAHHASIDCYKKKIVFHPSMGKSFRFQGTKLGSVPKTISALKARKLIGHGVVAFLASVVEVRRVDTDVSTVPVVNEFRDVFPDELPGLPPEREVNFGIELELGTTPISKAPYRMAPAELKELKLQLQELLNQGFIRPSVSPWGAPVLFVKKKRTVHTVSVLTIGS